MAGAPTRGRPTDDHPPPDEDEGDFADTVMSVPGGQFDLPEQTVQARPMSADQFARPASPQAATVIAPPMRPTPQPQPATRPTPQPQPAARPHTIPRGSPPQEHPIIASRQSQSGVEQPASRRTPMPAPEHLDEPSTRAPEHLDERRGPKRLAPTDIVPELRPELKLARKPFGGYEVTDPNTGKSFALNEFEVSFARMFNGRRPVSEVLEAGTRLGIPINLDSLEKFIQTLDENGLLGGAPAAADAANWPSRGQWETHVRTLFQSGIRLLRMGKHAEAAGYFEALLQEDPDNIEARELLGMANAGPAVMPYGTQMPIGSTQMGMVAPRDVSNQMIAQPSMSGPMMAQQPMTPQMMAQLQSGQMPMQMPSGQMAVPMMHPGQVPMQMVPAHMLMPAPKPGVSTRTLVIVVGVLLVIVAGVFVVMRKTGDNKVASNDQNQVDPNKTDPNKTDPNKVDPNKVDPNKVVDPNKTDPNKVDPNKVDPNKVDPNKVDPNKVDPNKTDPNKVDPNKVDPNKVDPNKVDPNKTDPNKVDPNKTDPNKVDPNKVDPNKVDPNKVDPNKVDPNKVDPNKTDPNTTDPNKTDPNKTSKTGSNGSGSGSAPVPTPPTPVMAPSAGDVTSYVRSARAVKKGEKLFDIVRVTSDPAKTKELTAKVAEMEKLAQQDPGTYEAFLADARKDLANARHVSTTSVKAPRAGMATPQVKQGATVHAGQVLVEIQ